jgi:membrane protease YdiL (CAAX protease family)
VRRVGPTGAIALLFLAWLLLQSAVMLFVAVAMLARGLSFHAAAAAVTHDPLPLGAAQLAALSAVIAVGVRVYGEERDARDVLAITPASRTSAALALVAGLALQLPMGELAVLLARFVPVLGHTPEQDELIRQATRIDSPLRAITVPFAIVLVAPVTEELLFRGLLFDGLRARYGSAIAVGATAVLFGAFHLDPAALFYATAIGVVLGALRERSGSCLPTVMLHAGFNAMPVMVPAELVPIPGFNVDETNDVPWPIWLGSALVAAVALALLWRTTPKRDR